MKRAALLFIAVASAIACGAWRAHARAASPSDGSATPSRASSLTPAPRPLSPRKIDEYGNIRWGDERARLDNLAIEVRNDPTAVAHLLCYGGRRGHAGEARRRCERAAGYLLRSRGVGAANVVTTDAGFREDLTVELWLIPFKAMAPQPSPTLDPSEVTIVKDRPVRKRWRRAKPARAAAPRGVTGR